MNEEEMKIKAELAASIFSTLAEHQGTGVLEYLIKHTIEATNEWGYMQCECTHCR